MPAGGRREPRNAPGGAADGAVACRLSPRAVAGAGAAEGGIDACGILKPLLARGELQLIGATTRAEYRRHIEKDAALARRFGAVDVEEPSRDTAETIL